MSDDTKQALQRMEIKRAVRTSVRPLVGIYGESGTGKTYSALLLARGFVGPSGKIILGDTESGRGSLYADVIPGGYDTIAIAPPFSPGKIIELIELVEQHAGIGIIDSISHEWEGPGGVCDWADQIEQKSGKPGLHCWREPKTQHQHMMARFLRSSIPWIVCMRAKYKSRQTKVNGKSAIVKDEFTTPIQSEDCIYEMTIHAETLHNHHFHRTKEAHPELCKCFPEDGMIEIRHGALLAEWCKGPPNQPGQQGGNSSDKQPDPDPAYKAAKRKLWALTQDKHGGDKVALNQFLWDETLLGDQETVETLTASRLYEVLAKTKERLAK